MSLYYTKHTLYREIEKLRAYLGLQYCSYPINSVDICQRTNQIAVECLNFKTQGLQGMLYLAQSPDEKDVIILNQNQSNPERNFYCMHELIHSALHRNENLKSFNCFDIIRDKQDRFLEWHANEGAAEFLVPYYDFIPSFCREFDYQIQHPHDCCFIRYNLAEKYGVTVRVIENRLETLRYEIDQFRAGIPINQLRILSKNKQEYENISSTNYNVLCDFAFNSSDVVNI